MVVENEDLIAALIAFVEEGPRTYDEVMNAWRTTCPRLTVWEDALDLRLLEVRGRQVVTTDAGRQLLARRQGTATAGMSGGRP